jgi:hypothetical protein
MTPNLIDKRVKLLKGHLYNGQTGMVKKGLDTIIGFTWYVQLDDGHGTAVKPELLEII